MDQTTTTPLINSNWLVCQNKIIQIQNVVYIYEIANIYYKCRSSSILVKAHSILRVCIFVCADDTFDMARRRSCLLWRVRVVSLPAGKVRFRTNRFWGAHHTNTIDSSGALHQFIVNYCRLTHLRKFPRDNIIFLKWSFS